MNCQNCGVELPRSHSNRRTCSGACRTALYRASKLIPKVKPDRRKRPRLPRYFEGGLVPEKSIAPSRVVDPSHFVLPQAFRDPPVTCQDCGREIPHPVPLHSLELTRQRIAGAKEWERELKARLDARHETGEDPAMLRRLIKDAIWCQGPMYRYPVPVTRGSWSRD